MTTQNFDDEVDVYFNIHNELFYWICPEDNVVKCADEKLKSPVNSWYSIAEFKIVCNPKNPEACLIKV